MQYVIRTRSSGARPFLVVRDVDGEIMGSYGSQEEADTALGQFEQQQMTWEALIAEWNGNLVLTEDVLDCPQYFARTRFVEALVSFVQAGYAITEGDDPDTCCRVMETKVRDWSDGDAFRDFRRADVSEVEGVRRTSVQIGQYTAHRLSGEADPVRRAAYEAVQTLAAVAVDGLQGFPVMIGNPFAHQRVVEALIGLRGAIQGLPVSSDTPGPKNIRETLKGMLPR